MDKLDDSYEMLDLGAESSAKPIRWILLLVLLIGMISGGAFWWQAHQPSTVNTVGPINNNISSQVAPQPPKTKEPAKLKETILFDEASASVRADQTKKIEAFWMSIAGWTGTINLYGYTDDLGSEQEGLVLSQARAESVAVVLRTLSSNNVKYKYNIRSFGEGSPIGDNRTEAGRAQNRRVEIEFIPSE